MGALGAMLYVIVLLPPFWRLWQRTGHSAYWSILALIPFVNLFALFWLAFKRWPAEEARMDVADRF